MKVFILHTDEAERLDYLIPQAENLTKALQSAVGSCELELIGPKERRRDEILVPNTWANRLRRAKDAARLFSALERSTPAPNGRLRKVEIGLRTFFKMVTYKRPLTIEQDLLAGHVECWARLARDGGFAFVMENDALFDKNSVGKILSLVSWLNNEEFTTRPVYVDLAGGCNRHEILNAWGFDERYGGQRLYIEGFEDSTVFLLPFLTGNTTCAYYINAEFAQQILSWYEECRPMLGVDWTIMLWAAYRKNFDKIICIHSDPTILTHGSVVGAYQTWG